MRGKKAKLIRRFYNVADGYLVTDGNGRAQVQSSNIDAVNQRRYYKFLKGEFNKANRIDKRRLFKDTTVFYT